MSTAPFDDTIATSQDRRREVRARHHNGLDIVETHEDRRGITLMFLEQAPQRLGPGNIRIDGPTDQPALVVTSVRRTSSSDPRLRDELQAELSAAGGEGSYRVSIVEARSDGQPGTAPLRGMDPRFTSCTLRFDIDEPVSGTVAAPQSSPAAPPAPAPSYLARDYEGLLQLLLNVFGQDMPDWSEQHVPDVMIMLAELFAFAGDDLSYYQDAVATEAYLQTARQRTSIRRHARLVGYPFHEGCHARAWVFLDVAADGELALDSVAFTAQTATATITFTPLHAMLPAPYAAGETPAGRQSRGAVVSLLQAQNDIDIWGWGESNSYLPLGATEATLVEPNGTDEPKLQLQPGDLLMFEELVGGDGGPPDETHRHVVRLTRVEAATDPLFDQAILEVTWDRLDALPFQLPVTIPSPDDPKPTMCSVAHGNLILVGEGQRVTSERVPPEPLESPTVLGKPDLTWSCPYPGLDRVAHHQAVLLKNLYHHWRDQIAGWYRHAQRGTPLDEHQRAELNHQFGEDIANELGLGADPDAAAEVQADNDALALWILLARADDLLQSRRRRLEVLAHLADASGPLSGPLLAEVRHDWGEDITHGLDPHQPASWGPAVDATTQDPIKATPILTLADWQPDDTQPPTAWEITTGLVDAEPETPLVIVEMDDDRAAHLRFNPAAQPPGPLAASYLVGNGAAGNVAAETISEVVIAPVVGTPGPNITLVRNPLPAIGGQDPETLDHARRAIPGAYLSNQPRALTPADYVVIASTVPGVRTAAAELRWNGSRLRIRVAVQPSLGEDPDRALLQRVENTLVTVRRIGHDLRVTPPDYRAVKITVVVTVDAYTSLDIARAEIGLALGSGLLADGQPAFFSPTHFSFGDPLYQSALLAAVQEQPGVVSVQVTEMRFLTAVSIPNEQPPDQLSVSPTGIIRCDNDPASPENGYAQVTIVGGR
jgi:predicted phage baseplate assembly protein